MTEERMPSVPEEKKALAQEIAAIKKEIVESRNMTIKTDNQMRNLFGEIRKVAGHQEDAQRRQKFNTAVVYILFVLVFGVFTYFVSGLRVAGLKAENGRLTDDVTKLEERIKKLNLDIDRLKTSEVASFQLYRAITRGKESRLEAIAGFEKFKEQYEAYTAKATMELFKDRIATLKRELAEEAFERAKHSVEVGSYANAIADFNRAVEFDPQFPSIGEVFYYRGFAYWKTRKFEQAGKDFETSLRMQPRHQKRYEAWFYIGQALADDHQYSKALTHFQMLLNSPSRCRPRTKTWWDVKARIRVLQRKIAQQRALRNSGSTIRNDGGQ